MLSIAATTPLSFGGFAKAAAPKAAPKFAYGLPGNFNALGGSELNWDPAGFLEGKSELEVNRYREAELTHGRVGMLASLGFLVQEKFHPLFSGDGGPPGLRAGPDRLRPARPRAGGPGRVRDHAGEGARPRAPRDDRRHGLPRAGGRHQGHLGHDLRPPGLLNAPPRRLHVSVPSLE